MAGADEVGLTMLSQVAVFVTKKAPNIQLIFRDPTTVYHIPNYEGQPMIETLQNQVFAAGGILVNSTNVVDIYLLVNNFSEDRQIEAPNQPLNRTFAEFDMFLTYLTRAKVIGFG